MDVTRATDEILELTGRHPESIWLYEGVLEVAYEVDLFGRVRRSVEAARADDAAVAATQDCRQDSGRRRDRTSLRTSVRVGRGAERRASLVGSREPRG